MLRVALAGWETDDDVLGALAGLGTEVVAFTRWHPGQADREDMGGWVKQRCPHLIGGGRPAEAGAFRESVLGRLAGLAGTDGFDVVHALDPMARSAAAGLAARSPGCALVASVSPV